MSPDKSLFSLLKDLATDAGEQAAYRGDPSGYLADHGFDDVDEADLAEAMSLVAETLPAPTAAALTSTGAGLGEHHDPIRSQLDHLVDAAETAAPPAALAGATNPATNPATSAVIEPSGADDAVLQFGEGHVGQAEVADPTELDEADDLAAAFDDVPEVDLLQASVPVLDEPDLTFSELVPADGFGPDDGRGDVDLSDESPDLHLQDHGVVARSLEALDTDLDAGFF